MHQPETNRYAEINRGDFDQLRRTRPVYQDDPATVLVDPTTFANTPKLSPQREGRPRRPRPTAEQRERARLGRLKATAISRLMHQQKRKGRSGGTN